MSFSFGDYINSGTDYGTIGNFANDFIQSGNSGADYSSLGDVSSSGFSLGNLPWGKIAQAGGTLGRLASGLMTGMASNKSQQQPDYIFMPRYLGNGLASTQVIDRTKNKQNQLNQILGSGDYLSSLFSPMFNLFGNSQLSKDISNNSGNNGVVANEINKYINQNNTGIQDPSSQYTGELIAQYPWLAKDYGVVY